MPLSPERILDTRPGAPTIDGKFAGIGIREAGTTLELEVAGRGGVPADATSVVLNLTATDGTGTGYVTVWACGSPRPIASSLNFVAGVPKPNAVLTGIGTGGKVCIYTAEANAQLIADVNGLLPADGGYAAGRAGPVARDPRRSTDESTASLRARGRARRAPPTPCR